MGKILKFTPKPRVIIKTAQQVLDEMLADGRITEGEVMALKKIALRSKEIDCPV
jgi:hypothetical protein